MENLSSLNEEQLRSLSRKELQGVAKKCGIKANAKNDSLISGILEHIKKAFGTHKSTSKANKSKKRTSQLTPPATGATYNATDMNVTAKLAKTPLNPLFEAKKAAKTTAIRPSTKRKSSGKKWASARKTELAAMQEKLKAVSAIKPPRRSSGGVAKKPAAHQIKRKSSTNGADKNVKKTVQPKVVVASQNTTKPVASNNNLHKKQQPKPPQFAVNSKIDTGKRKLVPGVSVPTAAVASKTKAMAEAKKPVGGVVKKRVSGANGAKQQSGVGPYPNERARQAAEKYAERMKRAQAARFGNK